MMERQAEAITEMKRAIRLDPHVSVIRWGLAVVYWCGRRYDEAIEALRQSLALDPDSAQAHFWLGLCYLADGSCEPALTVLRRAVELSQGAVIGNDCLGEAYAAAGFTDHAHTILQELSRATYLPKYSVARLYAALGMQKQALELLEAGSREHSEWLPLLKVDSRFDDLRPDSRFQDLLLRMNFPVGV